LKNKLKINKAIPRLIVSLLVLVATLHTLNAQSFIEYKGLIDPNQDQTVLSLEGYGFEVVDVQEGEGCKVHKLKKGEVTFNYSRCEDEEGVWINFVLVEHDLKTIVDLLNMAEADASLISEHNTIASNSAILFIEEGLKEIYFMFDHSLGLYILSGSNTAQFEIMKENIESNLNFNPKQDIVSLMRRVMEFENEKGETIQSALNDFALNPDFDLLDIPSAFNFIEKFKNGEIESRFKQIIDSNFLNDESYIRNVKQTLVHMEIAFSKTEGYTENMEEVLLKVAIENNQMKSFLMFNYVFEKVKKIVSASSSSPECDLEMFSTKKLVKLDAEAIHKITLNDTLYFKNDILLTKSLFDCPEGRIRKMKVLRNLKDTTALLIPNFSDFTNDSLLYTNTHFFQSPLENGLIVSNQKDRNETHYDYPEDDALYTLTKELNKSGLYKLDNGKFVFLTESLSQDSYKEHCTNETCYIPYPGILYDRKINLNRLNSLQDLEYLGQ
tara:strand:+ start:56 stop:1546 length:1491 start_codon:yes stop_codon:yes gene_type:complete